MVDGLHVTSARFLQLTNESCDPAFKYKAKSLGVLYVHVWYRLPCALWVNPQVWGYIPVLGMVIENRVDYR